MVIKTVRKTSLIIGDLVFGYFSLFLALFFRYQSTFNFSTFLTHLLPFTILFFSWFLFFYIFDLYDLSLIGQKIELSKRFLQAISICFLLGIIFFYLVPYFKITPKTNLLIVILFFGTLTYLWRRAFSQIFASRFLKKIAILGKNKISLELAKEIEKRPSLGYLFAGFLSSKKNLLSKIKRKNIQLVIICSDLSKDSKLTQILYKALPLKISFLKLEEAFEFFLGKIPIEFISQLWFLENLQEGEKRIFDKMKRLIDILFASFVLILSFLFWVVIALAIKLEDRGPIFYKQERVGKDKKIFLLWKFRSMKPDAEKEKALWAKENDPRITKVGKVLRFTHLDELPQMINILKGDISLVGPRPERPIFVKKLEKKIPYYHLRHIIKPGFTGWAQIKFRYARTIEDSFEKFQYDLYYIKNRSFFLDLIILLKTFQLLFRKT